jgi:hypothetical protein
MVMRGYSVSLDEKIVNRALKISEAYGSKLSPIINKILKEWCEKEEQIANGRNNYSRN